MLILLTTLWNHQEAHPQATGKASPVDTLKLPWAPSTLSVPHTQTHTHTTWLDHFVYTQWEQD